MNIERAVCFLRKGNICLFAAIAACWTAGPVWALHAQSVQGNMNIYGVRGATNNNDLVEDLGELTRQLELSKIVIFGGVHGYQNTGVPTATTNNEYPCALMTAEEAAIKNAFQTKYKRAPSFNYVDVKELTGWKNGEFSDTQLKKIEDAVRGRATGGQVSYIAWCWGGTWYEGGWGK
jgi:hypothetical protein